MPSHSLPGLPRRYDLAVFGTFGRAHDVSFRFCRAEMRGAASDFTSRCRIPPAQRPLGLGIEPIIDVLAHEVFGQSVALLDLALELIAAAVDLGEIIISQLTPLLLDLAFCFFPIAFNPVPIRVASPKLIDCPSTL